MHVLCQRSEMDLGGDNSVVEIEIQGLVANTGRLGQVHQWRLGGME